MKYYNYRSYLLILTTLSGLLFFISYILQLLMGNYTVAILNVICVILNLFNAFIYRKPYLALGEGKLLINTGMLKKEILINDITLFRETEKQLKFTYNQRNSIKKQKIRLSILKDSDRKQFINDFHYMLEL